MNIFVRKALALATAAGISLAAISAPAFAEKPKWASKSSDNIVTFAANASGGTSDFDLNGEDFDVLIAALIATDAISIFDGTDYTVFAPNDQAFYDLTGTSSDEDAFNAAVNLLGVAGVEAVLAYHVTDGVRNSRSVTRARNITMLDGNAISARLGFVEALFSEAEFIEGGTDNRLTDGMVHIIDAVLLPVNPAP